MANRYITAVADSTELAKVLNKVHPGVVGIAFKRDDNTFQLLDPDGSDGVFLAMQALAVGGVAGGYKIARGVHQQAAASDTIVSGLTTVVAVIATFRDTPTAKQNYLTTTIGDQAGTPAAGSFLSKTFKSTYAAADDFTDNLSFNWIAIGT